MAMTKAEKEKLEAALTAAALRTTADVLPDVLPPEDGRIVNGWYYIGLDEFARVLPACTSNYLHNIGGHDRVTSQGARSLYSTKARAAMALRRAIEQDAAKRLRRVDRLIEAAQEEGV